MKYEIGSRIRKYRDLRGLSQKQLAEMIGVSNSRVSNWEQGINRPDANILAAICNVLDVSPSDMLDIRTSSDNITEKERELLRAYRKKTEMQHAVDVLLGIDVDK